MAGDDPAEIIKAAAEGGASGAINALVAPIAGFLSKLFGRPAEQLGGMFTDSLAFRRWKNRVRMASRAEEFLIEVGRSPHEVPLPVLLPLLEGGANEEDEGMVDRWASLLAHAAGWSDRIPPSFGSILRDLSPPDGALLDAIFDWTEQNEGAAPVMQLPIDADAAQRALSADNLLRLGLVVPVRPTTLGAVGENREALQLTVSGRAFVIACRPPAPEPPLLGP